MMERQVAKMQLTYNDGTVVDLDKKAGDIFMLAYVKAGQGLRGITLPGDNMLNSYLLTILQFTVLTKIEETNKMYVLGYKEGE